MMNLLPNPKTREDSGVLGCIRYIDILEFRNSELLRAAKLHSPKLYEDLVLLYKKLLLELEKPLNLRNKNKLQKSFSLLIEKKYTEPLVSKTKARMKRDQLALFTCLDYEGVLPENNTAERAIRKQVVMRKIFGGSRSLAGAKVHEVNTSVLETMRLQNPNANFLDLVLPILKERIDERYSEL